MEVFRPILDTLVWLRPAQGMVGSVVNIPGNRVCKLRQLSIEVEVPGQAILQKSAAFWLKALVNPILRFKFHTSGVGQLRALVISPGSQEHERINSLVDLQPLRSEQPMDSSSPFPTPSAVR